jgi:hypothetical protein
MIREIEKFFPTILGLMHPKNETQYVIRLRRMDVKLCAYKKLNTAPSILHTLESSTQNILINIAITPQMEHPVAR